MLSPIRSLVALAVSAAALVAGPQAVADPVATIVSGVHWKTASQPRTLASASDGLVVQAHTSSVLRANGRYYLFGTDERGNGGFRGVLCYSSKTLSDWQEEGVALAASPAIPDLKAGGKVQRARVLYDAHTHEYVMWMHIDDSNYTEARAGVAVSSTPCGPYRYLGSSRPLGHPSRDIGVFQDDDGTAYLLSEDRSVHSLRIDRMSADDRSVAPSSGQGGSVATLQNSDHRSIEAPAMVKVGGHYYLFGSRLTGYRMNDNIVESAAALDGFWSAPSLFAPLGSNTYRSQTDGILTVQGTEQTTYVYLGDRWTRGDLNDSTEVWYPMSFDNGLPRLLKRHVWSIDTRTGVWRDGR
ncbi:hypothetical protein ATY41_11205 [Leifsonia xyli subsp. xyli]|uniref:Beta-xylosidase n=2 Tax=Leifsonia xyli subsp. xyli TaxID=59736 RepID=Q6ACS3_LEIXX|nr:family 43 glycosylhydrolase [Leifsonia xyli]AAT89820.1 conserved hypothetical protein [Leifsonia xyli subsp. xyli str. CTCB07]ODA90158.1 hypothetical protein ATY41_11205 [Leifsonia xyli subsp. xyli]